MAVNVDPGAFEETRREDHFVVLSGANWGDYERLLELRGDRSAPRITYLEGVIEIMSPSRSHESIKSAIGRLCASRLQSERWSGVKPLLAPRGTSATATSSRSASCSFA